MSRVGDGGGRKNIEHNHLFSDGGLGGIDGLLGHLDKSSIFKRDLIETNPSVGIFQASPFILRKRGTSLSYCQSIASSRHESLLGPLGFAHASYCMPS